MIPAKNSILKDYKKISAKFFLILFLLLPLVSFAQGSGSDQPLIPSNLDGTKIKNPISYNTINDFIKAVLEGVIKIGIPVIAVAIVYSGFLFVSAVGNPEKLRKAKDSLLYSLIGATILLGAWAIAQLISDTVLQL